MSKTTNKLTNLIALTLIIIAGFGCGEKSNVQKMRLEGIKSITIMEVQGTYPAPTKPTNLTVNFNEDNVQLVAYDATEDCNKSIIDDSGFSQKLKELIQEGFLLEGSDMTWADAIPERMEVVYESGLDQTVYLSESSGRDTKYISTKDQIKDLFREQIDTMKANNCD